MKLYVSKDKITIPKLIISTILLISVNFIMESTMIALIGLLFFITLENFINKRNDIEIIFLFILSIIMILISYYMPGNQIRIEYESTVLPIYEQMNKLEMFNYKLNQFFNILFGKNVISSFVYITSMFLSINLYKKYKDKKIIVFLTIVNLLMNIFIIPISKFYEFFWIELFNKRDIFLLIYLMINLYLLYVYLKNENKFIFYLVLSSFVASFVTVFVVGFTLVRYYLPLIVAFIVLDFYIYLTSRECERKFILLMYIILSSLIFGVILTFILIIIKLFFKKYNNYKIITMLFLMYNLIYFSNVMIKYYYNDKIFDENVAIIKQMQNQPEKNIILKKLKYTEYAYDMPENSDYVSPWYKNYHYIAEYNIIWE